ncbi:MAG: hypothetical protein AB7O73_00260 [Bacteroidia bacterium]
MFSKIKLSLIIIISALSIVSCKKTAGEGGKASIYGTIIEEDWNSGFTTLNGIYAGSDRDVYIIYGDEINYGDKVTTNYKGEYEFNYLRKGKYKVYIYSKDKTLKSQSGDTVFVKEVEITGKKQKITIDPITIYK